jgi:hypothetical protein
MPRHHDPDDHHRFERGEMRRLDRDRHEEEGPLERVADTGGENRSWRERRHHPDEQHEHGAGGTYGFRDQSEAARRSRMRTDQRYEDSAMDRDAERRERDYGRRDPGHSGYGSSGQGVYGRGGFAQGGYGQTGIGQDYGQRDPARSDAATGLHPDHDLEPDYLEWRRGQLSAYDRDYAHWRDQQARRHDQEYRRWRDERRSSFHQSFSAWRNNQSGLTTGVNTHAMQPGLSANAAEISEGSGPGPMDSEYNADPAVVGERNAGEASVLPDTAVADDRRAASRGDGAAGAAPAMSPEANTELSDLAAGGGEGRQRKDGDR